MEKNNTFVKVENMNKPATRKQLWALYVASRKNGQAHDYRNDNLTMQQASEMLQKFNANNVVSNVGVSDNVTAKKTAVKRNKPTLETEFITYMKSRMPEVIEIAKKALGIKSVVEDDPEFFPNKKDRKQYAFFGYGCGITIINFDKRSKVGKAIKELSGKHHMKNFLQMFLQGFSKKVIKYQDSVGFPLPAMFMQDYMIGRKYHSIVADFMEMKGVKNVSITTFDD